MNNKGFSLIETVVAVSSIFIISIPLYVLTNNILSNYNETKSYDLVDDIYALNNIKVFLYTNYNVNNLCNCIDKGEGVCNTSIIPLYQFNGSNNLYTENNTTKKKFEKLMDQMEIDTLIFTSYNDILNHNNSIVEKTKEKDTDLTKYIEYISNEKASEDLKIYRLIAKFKDSNGNVRFASINMYKTR